MSSHQKTKQTKGYKIFNIMIVPRQNSVMSMKH